MLGLRERELRLRLRLAAIALRGLLRANPLLHPGQVLALAGETPFLGLALHLLDVGVVRTGLLGVDHVVRDHLLPGRRASLTPLAPLLVLFKRPVKKLLDIFGGIEVVAVGRVRLVALHYVLRDLPAQQHIGTYAVLAGPPEEPVHGLVVANLVVELLQPHIRLARGAQTAHLLDRGQLERGMAPLLLLALALHLEE